jgi:hypothetical protein
MKFSKEEMEFMFKLDKDTLNYINKKDNNHIFNIDDLYNIDCDNCIDCAGCIDCYNCYNCDECVSCKHCINSYKAIEKSDLIWNKTSLQDFLQKEKV